MKTIASAVGRKPGNDAPAAVPTDGIKDAVKLLGKIAKLADKLNAASPDKSRHNSVISALTHVQNRLESWPGQGG